MLSFEESLGWFFLFLQFHFPLHISAGPNFPQNSFDAVGDPIS